MRGGEQREAPHADLVCSLTLTPQEKGMEGRASFPGSLTLHRALSIQGLAHMEPGGG